jgi:hypothetical protein
VAEISIPLRRFAEVEPAIQTRKDLDVDAITIGNHFRIEFTEDVHQVVQTPLKPSPPTRHKADRVAELYRFGRTLGRPASTEDARWL